VLPERRAIDPEIKNMWRIVGSTGAVGIEVAVAIAIGYFGGHTLDNKLGTQPWMMYLGILAGIGAAIKALVRVTRDYRRSTDTADRPASQAPSQQIDSKQEGKGEDGSAGPN
jgi:F0F1-type ATP synthase assembly protein I